MARAKTVREHDIQTAILLTLGVEQYEIREYEDGSRRWCSLNVWLGDNGKIRLSRNNTGATKTKSGGFVVYGLGKGGADIVGVVYGYPVAIEVKKPGEKQRPEQRAWQEDWERAGGVYVVMTSQEQALELLSMVRTGRFE